MIYQNKKCRGATYQLLTAIFLSTLLISCEDGSSSNNIEDADIECSETSQVTIDGRNVCPDE